MSISPGKVRRAELPDYLEEALDQCGETWRDAMEGKLTLQRWNESVQVTGECADQRITCRSPGRGAATNLASPAVQLLAGFR